MKIRNKIASEKKWNSNIEQVAETKYCYKKIE